MATNPVEEAAAMRGAMVVIRAIGEHITERMNALHPRIQRLERHLCEAYERQACVDAQTCVMVTRVRQLSEDLCDEVRKFPHVREIRVRATPIGDVLDLNASIDLPEAARERSEE